MHLVKKWTIICYPAFQNANSLHFISFDHRVDMVSFMSIYLSLPHVAIMSKVLFTFMQHLRRSISFIYFSCVLWLYASIMSWFNFIVSQHLTSPVPIFVLSDLLMQHFRRRNCFILIGFTHLSLTKDY